MSYSAIFRLGENRNKYPVFFKSPTYVVRPKFTGNVTSFDSYLLQAPILRQREAGDCFLVALFDAMLHNPKGLLLFRQIGLEENDASYIFHFPSGKNVVIGKALFNTISDAHPQLLLAGPEKLQLLELSYLYFRRLSQWKLRKYRKNGADIPFELLKQSFERGGSPDKAFKAFFGVGYPAIQIIRTRHNGSGRRGRLVSTALNAMLLMKVKDIDASPEDYLFMAGTYKDLNKKSSENIIERSDGSKIKYFSNHYYSVRRVDMSGEGAITVVNPHDTSQLAFTVTWAEFKKIFENCIFIDLRLVPTNRKVSWFA